MKTEFKTEPQKTKREQEKITIKENTDGLVKSARTAGGPPDMKSPWYSSQYDGEDKNCGLTY